MIAEIREVDVLDFLKEGKIPAITEPVTPISVESALTPSTSGKANAGIEKVIMKNANNIRRILFIFIVKFSLAKIDSQNNVLTICLQRITTGS
ncbi:hypothetical protein FORC36_4593 (plasmid) [Vibrio vulnificus]|uniref:Uncharacterized protein n=2 Tax=Vibrio TaxID=662 RepID=A0AAN1PUT1_VIBVL|nr:hypothetical protein FORC36_4593 [Vibrio vulnificus]AXX63125.1 hypothetical protein FORC53_4786 [Vibrio vulnificus]